MQSLDREIKEVIDLWFDASTQKNLNTTNKTELFERIERLCRDLKITNDNTLYNLVISEFNNRKSEAKTRLAKWIGKNSQEGPNEFVEKPYQRVIRAIEGAYKPFDCLIKCISHNGCILDLIEDYDSANFDDLDGKDTFLLIDYLARKSFKKMTTKAEAKVPELPKELKKTLVSYCPNLISVSKAYNEEASRSLTYFDFEILPEGEKQKIGHLGDLVDFLGEERCENIRILKTIPYGFLMDEDEFRKGIISPSYVKFSFFCNKFPGLKYLSWSGLSGLNNIDSFEAGSTCDGIRFDIDFSQFENFRSINLSSCFGIKNFSDLAKLKKLRILNISYCTHITKFIFLNKMSLLKELDISYCTQITDFSFLNSMINLEKLKISCTKITDLNFLNKMFFLKELDITGCTQVIDFNFLNNPPLLSKLECWGCFLPEDIIQGLLNRGIEVGCERYFLTPRNHTQLLLNQAPSSGNDDDSKNCLII